MPSTPPPAAAPPAAARRVSRWLVPALAAAALLAAGWLIWQRRQTAADVETLLRSPSWPERANAAIRLGRRQARATTPALVAALSDRSLRVQCNCRWALRELTGQPWGYEDGTACRAWWEVCREDFLAGRPTPAVERPAPVAPLAGASPIATRLHIVPASNDGAAAYPGQIVVKVLVHNLRDVPVRFESRPVESYDAIEYGPGDEFRSVEEPTWPPSFVSVEIEATAAGGHVRRIPQGAGLEGLALAPGEESGVALAFPEAEPTLEIRARLLPTTALVGVGEAAAGAVALTAPPARLVVRAGGK